MSRCGIKRRAKKFRFINFNIFMLFMVNPFVPTMKDLKNIKPGIARFTDYASVVLKILVSFLSHLFNELMAEFTLYGRMGLVGFAPNVPSG